MKSIISKLISTNAAIAIVIVITAGTGFKIGSWFSSRALDACNDKALTLELKRTKTQLESAMRAKDAATKVVANLTKITAAAKQEQEVVYEHIESTPSESCTVSGNDPFLDRLRAFQGAGGSGQ